MYIHKTTKERRKKELIDDFSDWVHYRWKDIIDGTEKDENGNFIKVGKVSTIKMPPEPNRYDEELKKFVSLTQDEINIIKENNKLLTNIDCPICGKPQ